MEGTQPPMMSFKAFLAAQDDNISDSEAVEKYNDYKLEFQRQQLNEFFVAHKDDEWYVNIIYYNEIYSLSSLDILEKVLIALVFFF